MNLLLDTHALIWFAEESPDLSDAASDLIRTPTNAVYISVATIWEMSIKVSKGKLTLKRSVASIVERAGRIDDIGVLPIDPADAYATQLLPHHHGDPFDRMLIAQAHRRGWTLVTCDPQIAPYDVMTSW